MRSPEQYALQAIYDLAVARLLNLGPVCDANVHHDLTEIARLASEALGAELVPFPS